MTAGLLQRYLAEIARNLPAGPERDDIIAEIGDELQSRIEAGEGSEYDVIKAYGHPRIVAARYKTHQYLIGPAVLPFYWYTMKIVLSLVLGVEIFGSALVALLTSNPAAFATGLGAVWQSAIWAVGVVTIVFALIERFAKDPIVKFNPTSLPGLEDIRLPRIKSAFEFIANFCTLLLLLFAGGWITHLIAPFSFTSAWSPAWYATLAANVMICAAAFAIYLTPTWTNVRDAAHVVADVVMIVGASLMLHGGGPYVTAPHMNPLTLGMLNVGIAWSLIVVILTLAIAGAVSLWKLLAYMRVSPSNRQRVHQR